MGEGLTNVDWGEFPDRIDGTVEYFDIRKQAFIVMDDGDHPFNRRTAKNWGDLGWNCRYYDTVKGTYVLWRGARDCVPFP